MKRTTYIMIGMLLASFVGLAVLMLTIGGEREGLSPEMCLGDPVTMDAAGVKAIRIIGDNHHDGVEALFSTALLVTNAQSGEKGSFTYPEAEYLQVSRMADTLLVRIRLDAMKLSDEVKERGQFMMGNIQMTLQAEPSLVSIASQGVSFAPILKHLTLDSLTIDSNMLSMQYGYNSITDLQVDSCSLRSFRVSEGNVSFKAKASRIGNLYLNLNGMYNWKLEDCDVDTEYLSGQGRHFDCVLEKGECKQMFWQPGDEESTLQVTLKEPSMVIVQ